MNKKQLVICAMTITAMLTCSLSRMVYSETRNINVAVIAPSISASIKAREIKNQNGWLEVDPQQADYILVVVRSNMEFFPLSSTYDSYGELSEDAENLPNITGSNYHIYLYELKDDLSANEVKHNHFEAED